MTSFAKTFKMTPGCRDTIAAGLEPTTESQRAQLLAGISQLAAEIEAHVRAQMLEGLRQQWGDVLGTMFFKMK